MVAAAVREIQIQNPCQLAKPLAPTESHKVRYSMQCFAAEDLEDAMKDPESAIFDSTASRDPAKLGFRGDFILCILAVFASYLFARAVRSHD